MHRSSFSLIAFGKACTIALLCAVRRIVGAWRAVARDFHGRDFTVTSPPDSDETKQLAPTLLGSEGKLMSAVGLLSEYSEPQNPDNMSATSISADPSANKADIENRFLLDDEKEGTFSCIRKLSNQTVLGVTCLLFFLFVVAEIVGALVRNELALTMFPHTLLLIYAVGE
jgi:hypothetical protein